MKANFYILPGIVFLILTWLFTGLFRDDEFYELSIFGKQRPTFKIYFYSPTGQSDLTLKDLSPDKQYEERAFQEFVLEQDQQNNSTPKLWYLPPILIQLTLTFMTLGFYRLKVSFNFQKWQLPTHFLINLLLTTFGVALTLSLDKTVWTILLMFLIFLSNYVVISLLTIRQRL
jgi:hypothetical protein